MARTARLVCPGVPHHVTHRGNRRQDIFLDDDDRRLYLRALRTYAQAEDVRVHAYCLMGNHVHALVTELFPDVNLTTLPETDSLYASPRRLSYKPRLEVGRLEANQGRVAVIYSPYDLCCRWNNGGKSAEPPLDVAANIYFYINKQSPLGEK